jgi:NADH-quinone oxidoreductase subunit N
MTHGDLLAITPLIILAAGSVICLLAGAIRPGGYLYGVALAAVAAALCSIAVIPVNAVEVMPGITVTPFSRLFTAVFLVCGLVGLLLAWGYNGRRGIVGEEYPSVLLFALVGMGAACAAGNLLMLFLGLESFTFAFYILVAIERGSDRGGEAGLKYLLNGTLSAAIMAMGMALMYASCGTLQPAVSVSSPEPLYLAGGCLVLLGFFFKLSLVPAHLWTPDVYHGAPAPVSALLSTASKAAALATLIFLLPVLGHWRGFHDLLWLTVLASLVSGNLAALRQSSIKRMLAWSSVAQMGYAVVGLVTVSADGFAAASFYVVAYAAAGLAAFGAVTVLSEGYDLDRLEDYRGLGYSHPLPAAVLSVAMFSLAGIPPTAGFMAKFAIFGAALRSGEIVLAVAGAMTALVAVFYYLRVVVTLYMKPAEPMAVAARPLQLSELLALIIPLFLIVVLGLYPSLLLDVLDLAIRG